MDSNSTAAGLLFHVNSQVIFPIRQNEGQCPVYYYCAQALAKGIVNSFANPLWFFHWQTLQMAKLDRTSSTETCWALIRQFWNLNNTIKKEKKLTLKILKKGRFGKKKKKPVVRKAVSQTNHLFPHLNWWKRLVVWDTVFLAKDNFFCFCRMQHHQKILILFSFPALLHSTWMF